MADNRNKRNYSDELYTITLHDQYEISEKIPERIVSRDKNAAGDRRIDISDSRDDVADLQSGAAKDGRDAVDSQINVSGSPAGAADNPAKTAGSPAGAADGRIDETEDRRQKTAAFISKIQKQLNFKTKHGPPPVITTASLISRPANYRQPAAQRTAIQSPANQNTAIQNPALQNPAIKTLAAFNAAYKSPAVQNPAFASRATQNPAAVSPITLNPAVQNASTRKTFIELARANADQTADKADSVPFMCYWPSYEYMSGAQLNWYFYLRGCLRRNEYPEADLSYVFVYLYELINQVGVESPEDGFIKLVNIWENYRGKYGNLDRYLTDWVGDYISYYKCDADKAFDLLSKRGLFLLLPTDMLAFFYFNNNLPMPIELIARFSDYKFYESGFVKGERGSLFTGFLPGLIDDARRRMNREKEGSFEGGESLRANLWRYRKPPFQRAVFYNPDSVKMDAYPPYEQHKPLRLLITSIIKEFENQLRVLTKYKGRLRPGKLPAGIADLCGEYAKKAYDGALRGPDVEITIDRERLFALIKESDEVRKRLIEGNYEYEEYADADGFGGDAGADGVNTADGVKDAGESECDDSGAGGGIYGITGTSDNAADGVTYGIAEIGGNVAGGVNVAGGGAYGLTESGAGFAGGESAGGEPAGGELAGDEPAGGEPASGESAFKDSLAPAQRLILEFLLSNGGGGAANEIGAAFPGVLVGVEIDKINDMALAAIGDILIGFEDDRWYIMEDYINDI